MSSFISQCPHCATSFNIKQAQLKLAKGKVRCGFCLQIFSALEQQLFFEDDNTQELKIKNVADIDEIKIVDDEIDNTGEAIRNSLVSSEEETLIVATMQENSKKKEELQNLEKLYDEEALNTDGENPVHTISQEPIPIYRKNNRPAYITFLLFFSNILLILGVAAQYTWANIDNYLRDSRFPSLTGVICNFVSCPAVDRFDLKLLVFSDNELFVNNHPSIPNALQIDFIFRNTAEFEQAFPLIELNFSDLNSRLVANRLFKPNEYLEQNLQKFTHLPPNSSMQVHLEISDPGPEALNYSITLRAP